MAIINIESLSLLIRALQKWFFNFISGNEMWNDESLGESAAVQYEKAAESRRYPLLAFDAAGMSSVSEFAFKT